MNKLQVVETLAKVLECSEELVFDIVYGSDVIYDENEIDYGL